MTDSAFTFSDSSFKSMFSNSANQSQTNTSSEVSVVPTSGTGSMVIPANFLKVGKLLYGYIAGTYQTPTIPGAVVVKIKIGSTVIAQATVNGSVLATLSTTNRFQGDIHITCRSVGTTGTVVLDGNIRFMTTATGSVDVSLNNGGVAVTIDTTVAQTLDVTTTWSNAQTGQGTITTTLQVASYN